jgi:hypothetical protein
MLLRLFTGLSVPRTTSPEQALKTTGVQLFQTIQKIAHTKPGRTYTDQN